jgi:predicted nuclease of predicted toxin-antitoxin system
MKLKLDENLGPSIAAIARNTGHDVTLVRDQGLSGKSDDVVIEVCRVEGRCLGTLALDFSNILNYPPERYPGIAVLRLPRLFSQRDTAEAMTTLLKALESRTIAGKLWLVKRGRIREYQDEQAT